MNVGKDVLYKVKNNPNNNWRSILLGQAYESMEGIEINSDYNASVASMLVFRVARQAISVQFKAPKTSIAIATQVF
ncbi:MAG: hypothetical protein GY751_08410 [Bacteroidetes bacterium]|nr:hypothetical protein [Bacteroidota bacterium]